MLNEFYKINKQSKDDSIIQELAATTHFCRKMFQ